MPKLFSKKTALKIQACIELIRKDDLFKIKNFTYESFVEDMNSGMKELFRIQSENRRDLNKLLKEEMELFDLLILEHFSLLFTLSPFFELKTCTYKGVKRKSYSFQALRTFTWQLNNASNNLLSIRALLSMGMDLQARVLFRNYIESMDISIAILLSEEFFTLYATEPSNEKEAKQRWYKVRTSSLLKVIDTELQKDKYLQEIWTIGLKMREENYSTTSKGVHVEPIAVAYASYPTKLNTNQVTGGVGGHITNATKSTILNIYYYGGFVVNFLHPLMEKYHQLGKLSELNKNGLHYSFLNQINKHMWISAVIDANNCMTKEN